MIRISNLTKYHIGRLKTSNKILRNLGLGRSRKFKIPIFEDFSINIEEGSIAVITGKSGSGKTTLLNIMSLLDPAFAEEFSFNGYDVRNMSDWRRASLRREEIGFVFQNYALIEELNVLQNVMLPLKLLKRPRSEAQKIARDRLVQVEITDKMETSKGGFFEKYPKELSGGQQQRVGIARALVHDPKVVFCDEPTGNLDDKVAYNIMDRLLEYGKKSKEKKTIIIVTHDKKLISYSTHHFQLLKVVNQPSYLA